MGGRESRDANLPAATHTLSVEAGRESGRTVTRLVTTARLRPHLSPLFVRLEKRDEESDEGEKGPCSGPGRDGKKTENPIDFSSLVLETRRKEESVEPGKWNLALRSSMVVQALPLLTLGPRLS
eukprot:s485_g8.t1